MKLRQKSLIASIIPATLLIVTIFLVSSKIVLNQFEILEHERAIERTERVVNAIAGELESLSRSNEDWAYWTDTYQFAKDKNEEYLEANLQTTSISTLGVNTIVILDNSNNILFAKEINLENSEEIRMDPNIVEYLKNKNLNEDKNMQGIININGNHILFTARPILTSEKEGPPAGFLIFGKNIDDIWQNELAELTKEKVTLSSIAEYKVNEELSEITEGLTLVGFSITTLASENSLTFSEIKKELLASEKIQIRNIDENWLASYAVLNDLEDKPSLVLKLDIDREIYRHGKKGVRDMLIAIFIFGSVIGIVNLMATQRFIVSRVTTLNKEVNKTNQKEINVEKFTKSKDEISELAFSIKSMFDQLKEFDQAKSNFLNIASHELKTPLTAIYAYLEVIKDNKKTLNPEQLKAIDAIQRNSHQLKILINNILELSRIEAGKFELSKNEINLKEKIDFITQNLRILSDKKGIKLVSKISPYLGKITTDEPRLEEIFNNLVSNAVKFTEKGSITIDAKRIGDSVQFSIKDTGVGIPKDKLSKLFEKFYQVDSSISRRHGGTGLGLSITKQLVELQGGKIWVESEVNKGTTFHFILPNNNKNNKNKSFTLKEVLGLEKKDEMKGGPQ